MISRVVFFLSVLLMCYASFFYFPRWSMGATEATISWDVSGYYWYLPSYFIYKDLRHQSFRDGILNKYKPTGTDYQQGMKLDNGNYCMKYSSGMALMYLPFFAVAHLVAGALGYPRDGFSEPYQFAIQFGGLLVAILGLWNLRKLLLLFYEDKVVAVVLFLLVFGSNFLNSAAIDCGMSHCWLFTIYVLLLLHTYHFYRTFKLKHAIVIGLLVGLATLTRPTDVISCLIPLLWGMESFSFSAIKNQFNLFRKNSLTLLLAVVCAGMVISIQLIYWHHISGHWFVYSYGSQGFSFLQPNFWLYCFNYRTGWLLYTPVMIFAFIGIIPFLRSGKNKVAILTFFLLNFYIVISWEIWWYGGRAMVQSYPVLLFPLAALVKVLTDRKILFWIFVPVALLFAYMNLWITNQYHWGKLYDSDCMTSAYFWRIVGRWHVPERTLGLKDNDDLFEGTPKDVRLIYQNDFEKDSGGHYTTDRAIHGSISLIINKDYQVSPRYDIPFTGDNAKWVRVQATFHCDEKEWNMWNMAQFMVRILKPKGDGNTLIVKQNLLRVYRFLNRGDTKEIAIDMKLPDPPYNYLRVLFWNSDGQYELIIDDLKVWEFNE